MTFCNMHGIVWSYNVSIGPKSTYTGINAQNLDGLSEKSDWTSISGASLGQGCFCCPCCKLKKWAGVHHGRHYCDPQEGLLEPWKDGKADCHQVQQQLLRQSGGKIVWLYGHCFLFQVEFMIRIQGEHCCNCNILSIAVKVHISILWIFEWLDKK